MLKIFALTALLLGTSVGAQENQLPPKASGQTARNACEGKRLPTFERYPAAGPYRGNPHAPILATALDRRYRTTIRDAAIWPDFAGHFAIASWGCGTGCTGFVMIDVNSGAVFDPPIYEIGYHYPRLEDFPRRGDEFGDLDWWCYSDYINYQSDSRLLIVEGCLGKSCGRTYFAEEGADCVRLPLTPICFQTEKLRPSKFQVLTSPVRGIRRDYYR